MPLARKVLAEIFQSLTICITAKSGRFFSLSTLCLLRQNTVLQRVQKIQEQFFMLPYIKADDIITVHWALHSQINGIIICICKDDGVSVITPFSVLTFTLLDRNCCANAIMSTCLIPVIPAHVGDRQPLKFRLYSLDIPALERLHWSCRYRRLWHDSFCFCDWSFCVWIYLNDSWKSFFLQEISSVGAHHAAACVRCGLAWS